jgi:hypothetical protein
VRSVGNWASVGEPDLAGVLTKTMRFFLKKRIKISNRGGLLCHVRYSEVGELQLVGGEEQQFDPVRCVT